MYRVGFGDFFLLTLPTPGGSQHILIDCGVTPGQTHKGDIGTIKDAVAHMADETRGNLALVIMTHRHMDHIIGFSRCADVFKNFKVGAVWMSSWESEYDAHAAKFQAEMTSIAIDAQQRLALAAGTNTDVAEMLGMLRNATGIDHQDTSIALAAADGKAKKGTGGGTNAASLALLKKGLGVVPEYYASGDDPKLPGSLSAAGLTAKILGPPPVDQMAFMKLMDLKKGIGQYLGEGDDTDAKKFEPFGSMWHATSDEYPDSAFREWAPRGEGKEVPRERRNRQLEEAVKASQPATLLTAVKALDAFLNNQSLVVLFTFDGKKLLFAGDAQGGNWEYWMYGGTPDIAPSLDKLTSEGKSILGALDFYKVGHHGSTNATPISAVQSMNTGFVAMCSTQEDSFGSIANKSEVPREPLMAALEKKCALVRSDQIRVTEPGNDVPPADGAPKELPVPKEGTRFDVGSIYVDYFF